MASRRHPQLDPFFLLLLGCQPMDLLRLQQVINTSCLVPEFLEFVSGIDAPGALDAFGMIVDR